ncbi:hypothetical protein A5735_02330 [Mycolicibacter heraklionensis]|nr:hypothetical protein A5735_02330 [Mycolicibacter heraklionensis]
MTGVVGGLEEITANAGELIALFGMLHDITDAESAAVTRHDHAPRIGPDKRVGGPRSVALDSALGPAE